jgi:uncharacterized membrane-anchored protein
VLEAGIAHLGDLLVKNVVERGAGFGITLTSATANELILVKQDVLP